MAACPHRQHGFTLIEMMVVVTIIGLVTYLVYMNMGAMVPKAKLDSEAKQLIGRIDFLRSEARIQGKRYVLQLDLRGNRWRYVLPAEERLTSEQTLEESQPHAQQWSPLDDGVIFRGAGNPTEGMVRSSSSNPYEIVFDENGFTSDQIVTLQLIGDDQMIWTVQIQGLTGQCSIVADYEGHEHQLDEIGEGAFP